MIELPEAFKERMKLQLGGEYGQFISSYSSPAQRAIRVNTLKITVEDFKKITPFALEQVPWESGGFYVTDEKPGKNPLHAAGAYYVQEPSAMSVVPELGIAAGERVLDLCSAPGGKGTQMAAYMCGSGLLVLNEINFSRAKVLSQNVERMGIRNAVVTCAPPETLADNLGAYFDKVLIDAPCSGEGMFKKEENAIPEWSPQNVRLCAERQREIIRAGVRLLKPGGKLAYSTCTFSPEEDEEAAEFLLKQYPYFELLKSSKLYPHKIRGEGHYFAVFQKTGGEESSVPSARLQVPDKKLVSAYRRCMDGMGADFENLAEINGTLFSLPNGLPRLKVQVLRAGVKLGALQKDRFIPDHALAMCLDPANSNAVVLDKDAAVAYLKGLSQDCPAEAEGWTLATYCNLPLGWGKAVKGVLKNHLPKGLRI